MGAGRGRGRGAGKGGPPAECICPACGYRAPHQPGVPCRQMRCPRCGAPMVRG
ncbi:MAG: hypothetical protein J7L58_02520 [Thermoplasmata archaeon]|nr:hypothetical protein [Thermoplasmata archaeon]